MRLTKQQAEYQQEALKAFFLEEHFKPGRDLVRHMAAEISLCHEKISKNNALMDKARQELTSTSLALEAERNRSRWEHFKRAIWIRHF